MINKIYGTYYVFITSAYPLALFQGGGTREWLNAEKFWHSFPRHPKHEPFRSSKKYRSSKAIPRLSWLTWSIPCFLSASFVGFQKSLSGNAVISRAFAFYSWRIWIWQCLNLLIFTIVFCACNASKHCKYRVFLLWRCKHCKYQPFGCSVQPKHRTSERFVEVFKQNLN